MREIFPGGQLPSAWLPRKYAAQAGFTVTRDDEIARRTMRAPWRTGRPCWQANKERAIEVQGQEAYDRFDKYLNGCVKLFREGYNSTSISTRCRSNAGGLAARSGARRLLPFNVNRIASHPVSCNS